MAEPKKLNTLSEAVYSSLADIGEDESRFEDFLHWGIEGARAWQMDLSKEIKTVECPLTPYKAIDFPDDYIDWTKIGIRCGDVIKTFVHDNSISLKHEWEDGAKIANKKCDITDVESTDLNLIFYNAYNYYGEDLGRVYGTAVQDNGLGYFKIHREAKQIQFRGLLSSTSDIYLEYLSDGWNPSQDTFINPYGFQLVKLYIHWMNLKYNYNRPRILVQEAKQEYWEEWERAKMRMWEFSIEDFLDVTREAYNPVPQI